MVGSVYEYLHNTSDKNIEAKIDVTYMILKMKSVFFYKYVRAEQLKRASNFGVVCFMPKTRISAGKSLFISSTLTSIAVEIEKKKSLKMSC